jgi:hypothetical protein
VESDSEDDETLPTMRESDRFATFTKIHNSSVGHFGNTKTLQAMAIAGHGWSVKLWFKFNDLNLS